MEFPHLGDTNFPILQNVNVYAYKNEFDYTRWVPNTRVKLMNVLWNSNYQDVVKFDNNLLRDKWFDDCEDAYTTTLRDNHSIPPEGGIKLPIPYDIAVRYNYMVIDIPVMTSADNPIEYESVENGTRRWYFFVEEVSSRAPSTTMFNISLDVWTQFQNDVEINYMFLERGHAPVAATDTDYYLANPISRNDYLLTPDVTPTNPGVIRDSNYIPFGNGTKYVCIASTCAPSQISNLGTVVHNSPDYSVGNITYSDTGARNGYQLQVNGYGIGNGDDYSNLKAPSSPINPNGIIANNVFVYAILASEVYGNGTFMSDLLSTSPQFLNTVLGCFVVDGNMLSLSSNAYSIAGHSVSLAAGTDMTVEIGTLTKEQFGYPERYQRFAKLYTYPYASLELTDNEDEVVTVRIENTGSISAHLISQLAFPFVNTRLFFTGIDGVGSESYTWANLDGTTSNLEIANSDWFKYCFDHEIPCFALYMDAQTAWYLDNFNRSVKGGRRNALVQYHNSVRLANTTKENNDDSNDTMVANTYADATTLTTNTANSVRTNRSNADITIANNSEKVRLANATANNVNSSNANKARSTTNAANLATTTTVTTENETTAACSFNSGFGAVAGQVMSAGAAGALYGAASGAAVGSVAPGAGNLAGAAAGTAIGAMVGVIGAASSWGASSLNADAVMQANSVTSGATISANTKNLNATLTNNSAVTNILNIERTFDLERDNDTLDRQTTNTGNNMNTNAGNTAATMRANAGRTSATSKANGNYTRGSLVDNAKETLENSRNQTQYAMADASNGAPRAIGSYGGDPTSDYMRNRGVQVRVRTMPDSEVRQAGDWFARYGYALEQVWDVAESGLCPMNHFCYWKCRDAWIDDRKSSNNAAVILMSAMFERGVTVWRNPDEVGRVSIYDN